MLCASRLVWRGHCKEIDLDAVFDIHRRLHKEEHIGQFGSEAPYVMCKLVTPIPRRADDLHHGPEEIQIILGQRCFGSGIQGFPASLAAPGGLLHRHGGSKVGFEHRIQDVCEMHIDVGPLRDDGHRQRRIGMVVEYVWAEFRLRIASSESSMR